MNELEKTRAKIVGLLVQDARLAAGRSVEDCARFLGITPEQFGAAEWGKAPFSLPDLEVLAIALKVPLAHFWGTQALNHRARLDFSDQLQQRQQAIGQALQQARQQAGRSLAEVAAEAGLDEAQVEAYEAGQTAIPLFQLERMGRFLGLSLDSFMEREEGPLAEHEAEQKAQRLFAELPPEVRAFVVEPVNRRYLDTAMELSKMDVARLRRIAESILDITF